MYQLKPQAFKSTAHNNELGSWEKYVLQAWKIFIGFQYDKIFVSADGEDFYEWFRLTYLSRLSNAQSDLATLIDTTGDFKPNSGAT